MTVDAQVKADEAIRAAFEEGRQAGRTEMFQELGGRSMPGLLTQAVADALEAIGSRLHGDVPQLAMAMRHFAADLRTAGAPPEVEGRSHANGQVSVRFTQGMDALALPDHVTVRNANGGQPLKVSPLWDPVARELTLTPARPLEPGTKYQVRVAAEAKNLTGIPLGEEASWEFTAR